MESLGLSQKDAGKGELRGNRLTQVHLEKWLLKQSVCVCYWIAEIPSVPDLRREGDGEHVHRGAEIHRQSSDGKPRGRARGKGWQWRLEILAHQIQAVQQVCNRHCYCGFG